jgi:uncharacterized protein YqjF (DUF2071 family)
MKMDPTAAKSNRLFRSGPWIMRQNWRNLLFAHWPVAPEAIQHLLPNGVRPDTYDGQAWIGVIAFRLDGIGLRGLPAVPPFNAFPEINVRTYVTYNGRPGVFFLSLDANNRAAMALARPWFRLPYTYSQISFLQEGDSFHFDSCRRGMGAPQAEFSGVYYPTGEPGAALTGTIEHFLTERYSFYTTNAKRELYRCDVFHQPWPLQQAKAAIQKNTMPASHGIQLPDTAPVLHYSSGVEAQIWPLRKPETIESALTANLSVAQPESFPYAAT